MHPKSEKKILQISQLFFGCCRVVRYLIFQFTFIFSTDDGDTLQVESKFLSPDYRALELDVAERDKKGEAIRPCGNPTIISDLTSKKAKNSKDNEKLQQSFQD